MKFLTFFFYLYDDIMAHFLLFIIYTFPNFTIQYKLRNAKYYTLATVISC